MASPTKDSLVPLLVRLYEEIREIEVENELWADAEDYRPRIERFHDAVRAYTSGVSPYDRGSRLSIEWLAQDLELLRAVQGNPLMALPNTKRGGTGKDVAVRVNIQSAEGASQSNRQAFRGTRSELARRYQKYAVMFAALLAETADMNHQERMSERDAIVEELENVRHAASQQSSVDLKQLSGQVVADPELAAIIAHMMPKGRLAQSDAERRVKQAQYMIDQQQQNLENAHMSWLSNQGAFYQDGKEVVTQLMQHGLNLAGKFLQEAMTQGMGGQGRGY